MKIGKLSENALERSVLRQIHHRRDEVVAGPSVGIDCAAIAVEPEMMLTLSTDPITGTVKDLGQHCIHVTANDIAASGAEPIGVMLTFLLPPTVEEPEIRQMMKDAEETCKSLNIEIIGGHTEITKVVTQPVVSVTGIGKICRDAFADARNIHPGQDVVVTKYVGLEATAILAKEKREELLTFFAESFVDEAAGFSDLLSVVPEAKTAMECGITAMHDVTEGGIFGALWEMAEAGGVGMDVDLRAIPIRQETVEICEYFHVNPYQIMSSGSMLIVTDNGKQLVQKLSEQGIHAVVIGQTTDGKDRILRNNEEIRYMDKPQTDELYKVI